ncbi:protein-L-isoaspartate O-methyltransferase [Streptomyces yangpuensis]|uniref:protein-L-isoaspartate O-methyltransferase family protein n=1 Tax=Streptomyces yangpuensis TaxID=1648182 RepID=UPI003719B4F0
MNEVPNPAASSAAAPPDPLKCSALADNTVPAADLPPARPAADTSEAMAARAAMVARLEGSGELSLGPVREALLALPRQFLLPHAYIRVSGPGADPIDWRLLDGSHPDDRQEWFELIHSDESILLQRDGEPLDALHRGPLTGGHMTSMSTCTPATVDALQAMALGCGQRYLELGPGPGVSLALAAIITGPGLATGVERDGPMAAFAQRNLDRLGIGAEVIEGDALEGHEARAPYDRIHSGIGVPCLPVPWVEQLAQGGRLLTTLVTRTPSWPGQLLVTRTAAGTVEAVLRGRPRGYRPLLGYRWLNAMDHRTRIRDDPGTARFTRLTPPPDDAYGFWLAAAYLAPGLVRDFQAETMTIVAPEDDSWAVAGPDGGAVRVHGPRDVWAELEDLHARWEQAGRPERYRVDLRDSSGVQHVTSGAGAKALFWTLPPLAAVPRQVP